MKSSLYRLDISVNHKPEHESKKAKVSLYIDGSYQCSIEAGTIRNAIRGLRGALSRSRRNARAQIERRMKHKALVEEAKSKLSTEELEALALEYVTYKRTQK